MVHRYRFSSRFQDAIEAKKKANCDTLDNIRPKTKQKNKTKKYDIINNKKRKNKRNTKKKRYNKTKNNNITK